MKVKKYVYNEEFDDYDGIIESQELLDPDDGMRLVFDVRNFTFCPEDAIIERGLFNANDYIRALNKGIELAKAGYDRVEIEE